MKAVFRSQYGPPELLEIKEVPLPNPRAHEVLVRVHATTVNRTDVAILAGIPILTRLFTGLHRPRQRVLGTDFAGEVEAVGKGVKTFQVGDRVWGLNDSGLASQAEYLTISEGKGIAHIPEGLDYHEAVACAEGAHYAYNVLNKVKLEAGNKVLVNGATGAIGSAALQLLKAMDMKVTAVGNTKNLHLLKALGADRILNYEQEDFTQDQGRYHLIIDSVGKSTFWKCRRLLLPRGIYISSELGPYGQNLFLPLITKPFQGRRVIFPVPFDCRRSILHVKELMEQGRFQAVIDRQYPMEDVKGAYRYVASGQKTGNVVLRIGG